MTLTELMARVERIKENNRKLMQAEGELELTTQKLNTQYIIICGHIQENKSEVPYMPDDYLVREK